MADFHSLSRGRLMETDRRKKKAAHYITVKWDRIQCNAASTWDFKKRKTSAATCKDERKGGKEDGHSRPCDFKVSRPRQNSHHMQQQSFCSALWTALFFHGSFPSKGVRTKCKLLQHRLFPPSVDMTMAVCSFSDTGAAQPLWASSAIVWTQHEIPHLTWQFKGIFH